jgi:hypothetical protein
MPSIVCKIDKNGVKRYYQNGRFISKDKGVKSGANCDKATKKSSPKAQTKKSAVKGSPGDYEFRKSPTPVKKPVNKAGDMASKLALRRKLQAKSKMLKEEKEKLSQKKTYYIWNFKNLLIPVDREILIPYHHIDTVSGSDLADKNFVNNLYDRHNAPRNTLIAVDSKTNDALKEIEENRVGWNEDQWNTFITFIYPNIEMTVLKKTKSKKGPAPKESKKGSKKNTPKSSKKETNVGDIIKKQPPKEKGFIERWFGDIQ